MYRQNTSAKLHPTIMPLSTNKLKSVTARCLRKCKYTRNCDQQQKFPTHLPSPFPFSPDHRLWWKMQPFMSHARRLPIVNPATRPISSISDTCNPLTSHRLSRPRSVNLSAPRTLLDVIPKHLYVYPLMALERANKSPTEWCDHVRSPPTNSNAKSAIVTHDFLSSREMAACQSWGRGLGLAS